MRAIVFERYGSAEELKLVELPVPEPKDYEVRVQVRAAAVNPLDGKLRRGEMKYIPGPPFPRRIGSDFAGVVDRVGAAVSAFNEGDEVLGWTSALKGGAYAEYIVVDGESLVKKPPLLSFGQAAAIPTAGTAALQGLRDVGRLRPGQRVLLNGCTGGVEMFATPLARAFGAHVTGVCGTNSVEIAKGMGAHVVLDYSSVDVLALDETFDVIFDLAGRLPFEEAKVLLTPSGIFVDPAPTLAAMAGSVFENFFHSQKHGILIAKPNAADVQALTEAVERLPITIRIGSEFPLEQAAEAHRLREQGGGLGKIVLTVP